MTVTYLGEQDSSRAAENNLGKRSYTRAFKLETDSKTDTAYDVGSHASLPVIGSVYPADTAAYVQSISIACVDGYKAWVATYQYSTERQIDQTDPDNDEVLVSWTSEIYQEPVFKDTSGNGILNSAGDTFTEPLPARDAAHLIAKIRKNVQAIPAWVLSYQNAVNSMAITIGGLSIAAGLAKMQRIEIGEREKRDTLTYYQISFEIHVHKDGWKLEPLDIGFRERNTAGKLVDIKNEGDSEVPTTPVMLDGAGKVLNNPTPATAVYREFVVYPELDFTSLPGVT